MTRHKIDSPGESYQKYLDTDVWVLDCLVRYYLVGLHKHSEPVTLLDLGTGAGYFPYICRYFGHDAEALDMPGNMMYDEITKALGIKRYEQCLKYDSVLESNNRYDIITAFMICFNRHKTPDLWHINEWEYFLRSVYCNHLKDNGEVYLSFNAESPEEPVSKELLEYFRKCNAIVGVSTVHIKVRDLN